MRKNFNEVLKEREREEAKQEKVMSLDSTERIKVLSPGQMVFKRFITNKLAIVGTVILFCMYFLAFIAPIFYKYGQTEIFYKYDNSVIDYAQASRRTDFSVMYEKDAPEIHYSVKNNLTATIKKMNDSGLTESLLTDSDGNTYKLVLSGDYVASLYVSDREEVCSVTGEVKVATYNPFVKEFTLEPGAENIDGFEAAIAKAIDAGKLEFSFAGSDYKLTKVKKSYAVSKESDGAQYVGKSLGEEFEAAFAAVGENGNFEFGGKKYNVSTAGGVTTVYELSGDIRIALLTTLVFDTFDDSFKISDDFKFAAVDAIITGKSFTVDGATYSVKENEGEYAVSGADGTEVAAVSNMVIRRYNGEDTLEFAFKEKTREIIESMDESESREGEFTWSIAQVDSNGEYSYDEAGNLIKEERKVSIVNKNGNYTMSVDQVVYLIDAFSKPSKDHIAGTDGDGMDVMARMMYGGRVSLLVAFVVIILETILGVIMGGIAGFFGGWVDNLIMRLVDIFYCIPSMPILIILGALFDALKMKPYVRLAWLMAVLGFLGWAGVARLVRGQILSLREQEFMVAAEAIGLRTKRRIFKHLVPNVMPQLIVTATSGLGGVILTESTLSYLGLGVKHPLATWGTMISSVSSAEAMKAYTYIWVPVGILICVTVVAYNFVGDGLRDAFDPKMKR